MVICRGSYYGIGTFPAPSMFSTPVELSVENTAKYLLKLYYYLFVSG